jgi:hypothetical protein
MCDQRGPVARVDQPSTDKPGLQLTAPPDSPAISPIVLSLSMRLLPEFGLTATIYWLYVRYIFPGEYRTTILTLDPSIDPERLKATEKHLARTLAYMDERLRALTSEDEQASLWEAT